MTDDAIPHQSSHPAGAGAVAPLAVLSLSAAVDSQPEFDEQAALISAASAEDSSVEEIALLRLLVFRRSHPDATVRTRLERFDDGQVVVRATITLRSGAISSAHAVAEGGVAGIERAEHRALGRALEFLGEAVLVNVTTADDEEIDDNESDVVNVPKDIAPTGVALDRDVWDDDDEDDIPEIVPPHPTPDSDPDLEMDAFEDEEPQPVREIPPPRFSAAPPRERPNSREQITRQSRDFPTAPNEETEPVDTELAPPPAVVDAVRRANLRRHGAGPAERGRPEPPQTTPHSQDADDAEGDPPLENYSWTAFWKVARLQGLDKMKVEQIIGEPILGLTPLQVREKLRATGHDL